MEPTPEELEALKLLADPWWRLTSGKVYRIKTADGRGIVPFNPREEQRELLRELLAAVDGTGPRQLVKLKARRLGFSTTIGVFVADRLAFRRSFSAMLIDQTGDDAAKKLNGIVKVALDAAAEVYPLRVLKSNESELTVDGVGEAAGKPSSFFAGVKSRGGSFDFLWPSELGVIQHDDPKRAEEITTGAFPSARHGVICVETTWKGGEGGRLYDIIKPSLSGTANDWAVSFCPWWRDPRNVSETAVIDDAARAYFAKIESRLRAEGVTLSDSQRRWYAAERRTHGTMMLRENPTFLDECWQVPIEGAVYSEAFGRAVAEGRVGAVPVDGRYPVHTSWDLGSARNTVVWYFQFKVGGQLAFVDVDIGLELTTPQRLAHMKAKGYVFGSHYLPHDADQERHGATFATEIRDLLTQYGMGEARVVPVTYDVAHSVDYVLQMLPSCVWDEVRCAAGIKGLRAYRWTKSAESGQFKSVPVHDWASHIADAARTAFEAERAGLITSARDHSQGFEVITMH